MVKKSNYHRTKERLLFDEIIMNFKPYYSVCKNLEQMENLYQDKIQDTFEDTGNQQTDYLKFKNRIESHIENLQSTLE